MTDRLEEAESHDRSTEIIDRVAVDLLQQLGIVYVYECRILVSNLGIAENGTPNIFLSLKSEGNIRVDGNALEGPTTLERSLFIDDRPYNLNIELHPHSIVNVAPIG